VTIADITLTSPLRVWGWYVEPPATGDRCNEAARIVCPPPTSEETGWYCELGTAVVVGTLAKFDGACRADCGTWALCELGETWGFLLSVGRLD